MTTQQFLELLQNNGDKELVFEYLNDQEIPKAYHITEVKSVHIDSVDCGGVEHNYKETVVQLWLSGNEVQQRSMSADKALKIFNIVDGKRPLLRDTEIFFEYGFGALPTSVYRVTNALAKEDQVIVQMEVPPTVCKPRELLKNTLEVVGAGSCGSSGCC